MKSKAKLERLERAVNNTLPKIYTFDDVEEIKRLPSHRRINFDLSPLINTVRKARGLEDKQDKVIMPMCVGDVLSLVKFCEDSLNRLKILFG